MKKEKRKGRGNKIRNDKREHKKEEIIMMKNTFKFTYQCITGIKLFNYILR